MKIDDKYGSLEEGKVADIVVWKRKPFVSITSPKFVIAEGKNIEILI